MLQRDRIKEAETNVRSYLSEGLIKKESPNSDAIRILTKISSRKEIICKSKKII